MRPRQPLLVSAFFSQASVCFHGRVAKTGGVSLKHAAHFVANRAKTLQNFLIAAGGFRRIKKRPVVAVQLAGENRTRLIRIAADGDDGVNGLLQEFGERLRAVRRNINVHFGHASEFQVYEASAKGITFIGHRKVDQYCEGGFGDDATLDGVIAALEGVDAILCAKIGDCPKEQLAAAGLTVSDAYAHDYIEPSVAALYQDRYGTMELAASA